MGNIAKPMNLLVGRSFAAAHEFIHGKVGWRFCAFCTRGMPMNEFMGCRTLVVFVSCWKLKFGYEAIFKKVFYFFGLL